MKTKSILLLAAITLTTYSCKSSEDSVIVHPTTSQHTGCKQNFSRETRGEDNESLRTIVQLDYKGGLLKGVIKDLGLDCDLNRLEANVTEPEENVLNIDISFGHAPRDYETMCLCFYDCSFEAKDVTAGEYRLHVYQNGRLYYDVRSRCRKALPPVSPLSQSVGMIKNNNEERLCWVIKGDKNHESVNCWQNIWRCGDF